MKKDDVLKLFPGILEEEINKLQKEFIVCWYPSSSNHFNAAFDWVREEISVNPDVFIYTDTTEFEIPTEAEVIFSRKIESEKFIEKTKENNEISLDGTWLKGIEQFEQILLEHSYNKEYDCFAGILHVTLLRLNEVWFFLVQVENEYLYLSVVEKRIKIDCLLVNRPCDSFLSDRGSNPNQINFIDIKKVGVDLLITGKYNGIRMPLSKDYRLISEFEMKNKPFIDDTVVFYSRIG
jgi:hypothetical protein